MYFRAIHWFRRDLRLDDNVALREASRQSSSVVPVYFSSTWDTSHLWTGGARQKFLCDCLRDLAEELPRVGGRLIHRRGPAGPGMRHLIQECEAEALFFNRDPDPFGQRVEREMNELCEDLGIACVPCQDVVLHSPAEILKPDGKPYRVFTPYHRRWSKAEKPRPVPRPRPLHTPPEIFSLDLPTLDTWNISSCPLSLPAGAKAAEVRLQEALDHRLLSYDCDRDFMSREATSRLSQDLRFGTLSIRTVYRDSLQALQSARNASIRNSFDKFISELAWREFYMQILFHFPEVLELEFNPDWRGLPWNEPDEQFERWREGCTGFPIIDAAMRELAATGFMHNRARMIVAMFLTKDLHLDWRLGEQVFMQALRDGEIASNNGGWQWSAGTGADAAPYFRIQNPWTQSKRYDPEGRYIRRWVPELSDVPVREFFKPPPPGQPIAPDYPVPILDHSVERAITLARFKKHATRRSR